LLFDRWLLEDRLRELQEAQSGKTAHEVYDDPLHGRCSGDKEESEWLSETTDSWEIVGSSSSSCSLDDLDSFSLDSAVDFADTNESKAESIDSGEDPKAPNSSALIVLHKRKTARGQVGLLCMALVGSLLGWLLYYSLVVGISRPWTWFGFPLSGAAIVMPSAGDRRYYRVSETTGLELLMLKKVPAAAGIWLVAKPDLTLATVDIRHAGTIRTTALGGVAYQALPVLAPAAQAALVTSAETALTAGTLPSHMRLARYGATTSSSSTLAKAAALGMAFPIKTGQLLRWCLRNRFRVLGLVLTLFLGWDVAVRLEIPEFFKNVYSGIVSTYESIRNTIEETGAWGSWVVQTGKNIYSTIENYGDPILVLKYTTIVFVAMWAFGVGMDDCCETASPCSSAGGSPASSQQSTPPISPRLSEEVAAQTTLVQAALAEQRAALLEMKEISKNIEEKLQEKSSQDSADKLLQEARAESSQARSWGEADRRALQELSQKVDRFRDILSQDRCPDLPKAAQSQAPVGKKESGSTPVSTNMSAAVSNMAVGSSEDVTSLSSLTPAAEDENLSAVKDAIRKMELKSELPQAIFQQQLKQYKEEDKKVWHEHFPVGYRTRIAGPFLAEIYGSGKTAEEFGKELIANKGASESKSLREVLPNLRAIDTLMLIDREPGLLNRVSTERLCRRAMGIIQAWKAVECKADWSKPAGAPKSWKSKVDPEAARRVDPELVESGHFRIRAMEEEIRKELERDAGLLKARAKLDKHSTEAET